jgi:hypothetical protein
MFLRKRIKDPNSELVYLSEVYNGVCYLLGPYGIKEPVYIKNQRPYYFLSPRAFESWKLIAHPIAGHLPPLGDRGGTLGFRDGTLIQNAKDGKIYLISDAKRWLLTKPLADYGFDWSDIIEVSDDEVEFHLEGGEI